MRKKHGTPCLVLEIVYHLVEMPNDYYKEGINRQYTQEHQTNKEQRNPTVSVNIPFSKEVGGG
jgi:hypothetical protein